MLDARERLAESVAAGKGERMGRVTALGGVFVRVGNPEALDRWYEENLGIENANGTMGFSPETQRAPIAVAFFPAQSEYFPLDQVAMLNFQVDDLDEVLDALTEKGVPVDPTRAEYEYGRFGWFTDPAGNRVELWQPPAEHR